MTTESHVPPVLTTAPAVPTAQVDPEIVVTAKRLHKLKNRTLAVLKPAALGAVGGLVVVFANRSKATESSDPSDDTVTDTNE